MPRRTLARSLAVLAALTCVACSSQEPLSPSATPDARTVSATQAGTYEISFVTSASHGSPVTSAPVGTEIGVRATVRNSLGELATTGSVTFERCMLNGSSAPSAECDSGAGRWTRIMSMRMDPSGFPPTISGGWCDTPRSVGFRFRYAGQKGDIASGASVSADFTWVAAS